MAVGLQALNILDGQGSSQALQANNNGTNLEIIHTFNGSIYASTGFTRPANTSAYASGQLVANSTVVASITPMSLTVGRLSAGPGQTGMIRRCRLYKSSTGTSGAQFRVHFFDTTLTSTSFTNPDGGTLFMNKSTSYIGAMDCDMSVSAIFSDGAAGSGAPNSGAEINFTVQTIAAVIEARGAYTPASAETFTLQTEVLQN